MDAKRQQELARELAELGQRFWAGEAEICRTFWSNHRAPQEQIRWLQLQCFKEMYGSGLHKNPRGIIRGLMDQLVEGMDMVETRKGRDEYERTIRVLREEFTHYRLFADILEGITGEPVRFAQLQEWQLPEDKKLQQVRQSWREQDPRLGEVAIAFTEGGGSGFFFEGRKIGGNPVADQIAAACEEIFTDELEHGEHGAHGLEDELETEEEWAKVREMITSICQQRLRMRYDMFGLPVDEGRIREITEGKIELLQMTA
jgi:hypothetical protein